MRDLTDVAPAFVDMAHRIVWASAATVDTRGRPRSRILHPIWEWDGRELVGYDPAIIPAWEAPTSDAFAVIRLEPWRLRVMPGSLLLRQEGEILTWRV